MFEHAGVPERATDGSPALSVAVLAYDDADLLDIATLLKVFETAARLGQTGSVRSNYSVNVISMAGMGVRTSSNVLISTKLAEQALAQGIDTLIVVGGRGAFRAAKERVLLRWIESHRAEFRRIGACGSGTFVLAAAGLLEKRRVTTHWAHIDELQATYPGVIVERDAVFLADRGVWTSAGVAAGIDMALGLVEEDVGQGIALRAAKELVIYLKRAGQESQFSTHLKAQHMPTELQRLLEHIMENPRAKCDVPQLTRYSGMSRRSLYRAFYQQLRMTPREFVEMARLEVAKRLLEEDGAKPARVAKLSGFASREAMRRVFRRRLGISPTTYRQRVFKRDRRQPIVMAKESSGRRVSPTE